MACCKSALPAVGESADRGSQRCQVFPAPVKMRTMPTPDPIRESIRRSRHQPEITVIEALVEDAGIPEGLRARAFERAVDFIESIRSTAQHGFMDEFLAEYGLSTDEGIALMCLAEAMLRVPDAATVDALIEDKIAPSRWSEHLGKSSSSLVNASTWALMLTGKTLADDGHGIAATLRAVLKRLGEPVIRSAIRQAMREMGRQFVLGQDIDLALARGKARTGQGFTYSFDMLGEAALTTSDAERYFTSYSSAISRIASACHHSHPARNPGISIKLSALHPRFEVSQYDRVMDELVDTVASLARQACDAGMGLNIDAEEADRLELTLDVAEAVLREPYFSGWDGFGLVVQAYGKRAGPVIDWLAERARELDRKLMVRLVKGAYWDTEIKRAQVDGLSSFPVFTRKAATDVSYLCCAARLLRLTDRIYPQFATHNAGTIAAILELATDTGTFEFQRLHGMGEALHDLVRSREGTRCRIYAPVGKHRDLLAYLVRRLLENGANSSFVNQIVDQTVASTTIASDPFLDLDFAVRQEAVIDPPEIYAPERSNSKGWDLSDFGELARVSDRRDPFMKTTWNAGQLLAGGPTGNRWREVRNPSRPDDAVGHVLMSTEMDVDTALAAATTWDVPAEKRARALVRASELYEENFGELFSILAREAGKTPLDAVAEVRESVDFLRYYAARSLELVNPPRGLIACISPWNFPLAIFTGQIAAALAAGNGVLAKPAEATGIIATRAVNLMHTAGVPRNVLQLLPGDGATVGTRLCSAPGIDGVCFTGSTATAQAINRQMSMFLDPEAPLIAETGGLNAMIVDSTALPEQAVRDIVTSAFQSAGQRCSALRMVYFQREISEPFLEMLHGAMDELVVGDPWDFSTDVGPVIDLQARTRILAYIDEARTAGRVRKSLPTPDIGTFVGPALIEVDGILDLEEEVFGPVLHYAIFELDELDSIVDDINSTGYGLTFGIHSRIDARINRVLSRVKVGNIYVNRNQIGAVVGSQPFGGHGLSGTGPKAGGPAYVRRLTKPRSPRMVSAAGTAIRTEAVQGLIHAARARVPEPELDSMLLPGPTGESNRLSVMGRGVVLCLGPTESMARQQAQAARDNGCAAVVVAPGAGEKLGLNGVLDLSALERLSGIDAVALSGDTRLQRVARMHLAARPGPLVPLIAGTTAEQFCLERHVCIDTTAAGGNASLLSQTS